MTIRIVFAFVIGRRGLRGNIVPRDPDIFIGWHKVQSHAIATIDQIDVFLIVLSDWVAMFEGESLIGSPNSWASVYISSNLTNADFRTGARRNFNNTKASRDRQQPGHLLPMGILWLQVTLMVHIVIQFCVHPKFTDPDIRANHGQFVGTLTPSPQWMLHWIDHWGVDHLMRSSTNQTYLVTTAIGRARKISWTDVPGSCRKMAVRTLLRATRRARSITSPFGAWSTRTASVIFHVTVRSQKRLTRSWRLLESLAHPRRRMLVLVPIIQVWTISV